MGMRHWTRGIRIAFLGTALFASVLGSAVVPAGAQVVATGDVVADPSLPDGTGCSDVDGAQVCSLRAAVAVANATSGTTVQVLPGVHVLTEGSLDISADGTVIAGAAASPGPAASAIVSDGTDRVIDVGARDVVIDGVVVTGGDAGRGDGGGIRIGRNASATVRDVSVVANRARDGGGVDNRGTLTIDHSTIAANVADRKGGGLRNGGTADVQNVTIVDNAADQGGGLSSPGVTEVLHATIVGNDAGSSSGGGVDRNGGTLTIRYSIIANNLKNGDVSNRDCAGTPDLIDLNLVSVLQGCNPVGTVIEAPPILEPLAPNGGPTETVALGEGSPALEAIAAADCVLDDDQRGTSRPTGEGCELGAYEEAPLAATFALDVDVSNYSAIQDPATAGPEVEVGVISVPTDEILSELTERGEDDSTSAIADAALRSVALRSVELGDLALRSVSPEAAALRSVALRSVDLNDIALRSVALRSVVIVDSALRSVALRSVLLSDIALRSVGGWETFIAETPELAYLVGVPLQSVTLEDIFEKIGAAAAAEVLGDVTLDDVSLDATALRSVALRSVLLAGVALRSVPIPDAEGVLQDGGSPEHQELWCDLLSDLCGSEPGQIEVGDLMELDLLSVQLAGGDVDDVPIFDIPLSTALRSVALRSVALRSVLIENTALRSVALRSVALRSVDDITAIVDCDAEGGAQYCDPSETNEFTLSDVPDDLLIGTVGDLADIALRSVALRSVALRSVLIDNTALRSVALRSVALRSVDEINAIVDCDAEGGAQYCDPSETNLFTLGDVPDALLIGTVGDLADLDADLIEGLSIGDLLLAFIPPDEPSWESLDIAGALLQDISQPLQPTFDYVATVEITGGPADLDFSLVLPTGFAAARAPGDPSATLDGVAVEPETVSLGDLQFVVADVGNGTHTLRVPVRAGLETGSTVGEPPAPKFLAFGSVVAIGGGDEISPDGQSVAVNVVAADSIEDGEGTSVLSFDDGLLNLAHVSREGDVDLYELAVPTILDGTEARIRLSNIPSDADYDLSFYRPTPPSLRNDPVAELDEIGDFGFDLDPTDDVYPTDVADDIPLDVPGDRGLGDFTMGDNSTRRSSEDEEVQTGVLVGGETYYVAVTPYLQSFSAQPYGLRVRLSDGVDLPECVAGATLPAGTPESTSVPTVPSGVNTLYVTNTQWLEASVGDTAEIFGAIDATAGTNEVVPMLVPVDAYPGVGDLYDGWKGNRCDPQARNAVVSGIGQVLDDIIEDAGGTVENIVIVGADGVVPMAAVPDLTAYSNESTFASSTLFPDATGQLKSNEVSSALGNGYLLTDDPYATEAGISINEGDHELFVPDYDIGRLVETGPEILGQLQHFVEFGGQLDPATAPGLPDPLPLQSLVAGYDFLDDGADEIEQALADVSTVARLDDNAPLWDRAAYLDLLDDADYRILSPNAHYDWESLLPAAPDEAGFFDELDLVTTADLELGPDLLPTNALIFTMGCHAGLSIDDVQVGFAAPDWAQTYAFDAPAAGIDPTTNLYAAHTTYGYGDTDIVAYSERLLELFSEQVAALIDPSLGTPPDSVGEALRNAKQEYLATSLVLTPYDEKILQSLTYYGLPMYDISSGESPVAAAAAFAEPTALSEDSPVTFGTPNAEGVTRVDIDLIVTAGNSGKRNLNLVETDSGDRFEVGGNTVAAQYRAVQPLVTEVIPAGVPEAAGLLITELSSIDLVPFDPLYLNPLLDLSASEGRIEIADGSFPASLQRIAPAFGDQPQRLNVAAGQFEDQALGGVQRIYPHIAGELYPLEADATADTPLFQRVVGRVGESEKVVQFEITTDNSAERVYVLFLDENAPTVDGEAQWRGVDLTNVGGATGSTSWIGAAPVSVVDADVQFFAQALNRSGVSITTNKVDKFLADKNVDGEDLEITLNSPVPSDPTNGYFTGEVTATVGYPADPGTAPRMIEISVDSGPFQTYDGDQVTVAGDGGHVVLARDEFGGREYVFLVIDGSAPVLRTDVYPDVPVANGPVTIGLSASDVGQSGVSGIVYTVAGKETTVEGGSASIEISNDGTTEVSAYAQDVAGNRSEIWTRNIVIDQTAPTVMVDPVPTGWVNTDVTVTVRATDDSGVAVISIDGDDTTFDPAESPADASKLITAEGTTTVEYSATDAGDNTSTPAGSVEVKIDKTPPRVPVFEVGFVDTNGNGLLGDSGDQAIATFRCADDPLPSGEPLSGLADGGCTVSVDGGAPRVATGTDAEGNGTLELPSDVIGPRRVEVTALDVAGNDVTTSAETYVTPYSVCLDYDPDQGKNVGSNYTIRVMLCDNSGANLSDRQVKLDAVSIDVTFDPGPNDSGKANSFGFRYQSSGNRYVYNLDTTDLGFLTRGVRHNLDFSVTSADGIVSYGTAPFTLS